MTLVNDTETLSSRRLDIAKSSSAPMYSKLSAKPKAQHLVVRCECGNLVRADSDEHLIDKVRLHIGEFHPDLGANIPADLILAMAEEKE
jgi:predicted small metal-binding protein